MCSETLLENLWKTYYEIVCTYSVLYKIKSKCLIIEKEKSKSPIVLKNHNYLANCGISEGRAFIWLFSDIPFFARSYLLHLDRPHGYQEAYLGKEDSLTVLSLSPNSPVFSAFSTHLPAKWISRIFKVRDFFVRFSDDVFHLFIF